MKITDWRGDIFAMIVCGIIWAAFTFPHSGTFLPIIHWILTAYYMIAGIIIFGVLAVAVPFILAVAIWAAVNSWMKESE